MACDAPDRSRSRKSAVGNQPLRPTRDTFGSGLAFWQGANGGSTGPLASPQKPKCQDFVRTFNFLFNFLVAGSLSTSPAEPSEPGSS